MACGCKNKGANVSKNVVKSAPTQESIPEKGPNGGNTSRIIMREIR